MAIQAIQEATIEFQTPRIVALLVAPEAAGTPSFQTLRFSEACLRVSAGVGPVLVARGRTRYWQAGLRVNVIELYYYDPSRD